MAKKPHEVNLCVLERFFHRCFEILLRLFHIPISSHTSMPTAFAAPFKRLKTTFCPLHREGCWTAVPQRAKLKPSEGPPTSDISHKDFMAMLEPAWMKGSSLSDIKAVLKRTGILVLYWFVLNVSSFKTSRCYEPAVAPSMQYRKGHRNLPDYPIHIK